MQTLFSRTFWPDILAGMLAGTLFCIVYSASLLMYLPAFVLMLCGFSTGARAAFIACVAGSAVVSAMLGLQGGLFFAVTIGLPSAYFVKRALLYREDATGKSWYPVERILTELTLCASAFFMTLALLIADDGQGGIKTLAPRAFGANFGAIPPDMAVIMQHLITDWSFVIFSLAGWLWILLLYGLAALANVLLGARGRALRASLAPSWRGMPGWFPALLGLCALLACFGHGNDGYCAKAVFLLLLLPYGIVGLARMHAFTQGRSHRRLFLILLYFILFFLPWLAVMVIAAGLCAQLSEMLDKPPKIG